MAGPKLSADQKSSLVEDIRKRLSHGQKPSHIYAELAPQYKVSPMTIRWHAKKAGSGASSGSPRKPRRKKQTATIARETKKLLHAAVHELTERQLRRVLKAKKIVAQYAMWNAREKELKIPVGDGEQAGKEAEAGDCKGDPIILAVG